MGQSVTLYLSVITGSKLAKSIKPTCNKSLVTLLGYPLRGRGNLWYNVLITDLMSNRMYKMFTRVLGGTHIYCSPQGAY